MKNLGFFLPLIILLLFSSLGSRLFASGSISPLVMIGGVALLMVIMFLIRPKASAPKPVTDIEQKIRGNFAKEAFSKDPQLAAKFQAALKDYRSNMPKAALNKLQKLAPLCTGDEEVYAVSMATALVCSSLGRAREAIREYVRVLSMCPSSDTAQALASNYQRIGELEKAIDTYQYAIDLDPNNIAALSALATAYVADGSYSMGLEQAMLVLEKEEHNDSALATAAICYGLMNEPLLYKRYTDLAVDNGYKRDKITNTVDALKKRK